MEAQNPIRSNDSHSTWEAPTLSHTNEEALLASLNESDEKSANVRLLSELPKLTVAQVFRIEDHPLRSLLLQLGIGPGSRLTLLNKGNRFLPMLLDFEGTVLSLQAEAAKWIRVQAC